MMFADHELIGIPHRVVVSERGLKNETLEYKARTDTENKDISTAQIHDFLMEILCPSQ